MDDRAALFLDIANLEQSFRRFGAKIDYLGLRDYIAEGRSLVETFAYLPINPRDSGAKAELHRFSQTKWFLGAQ